MKKREDTCYWSKTLPPKPKNKAPIFTELKTAPDLYETSEKSSPVAKNQKKVASLLHRIKSNTPDTFVKCPADQKIFENLTQLV